VSKPGQSINFLKKSNKDEKIIKPQLKRFVRSKSENKPEKKRSNFKCPSNPEKFKIPSNTDCKIIHDESNKKTMIEKGYERFILNNCKFNEDLSQKNILLGLLDLISTEQLINFFENDAFYYYYCDNYNYLKNY